MLDEFDWESTITPLGETTGLCIPLDVVGFVQVRSTPSLRTARLELHLLFS